MPTSFPGAIDALTNPISSNTLASPPHHSQHADANDAIEAIEGVLVGTVWFNVRAYGAVGDGIANDTAAINTLIATASALGSANQRSRVFFPMGTYLTDGILVKSNVWLDFGGATIKKFANGSSVNTNALMRTVPTQVAGSYYGTYKNLKITGGTFDPNGKNCPGHVVQLQFCEDLELHDVHVKHDVANPQWAFAIGGRRLNLDGLKVSNGTVIYQDGIHITHGQDIVITRPVIEAGDDALSIGGEPTDATLASEADGIARVTVIGPVLKSARVSCIKVYVQAAAPNTPGWTVTDVTVVGAVGGAKGSAPISIKDLGALGRIQRVKVTDFSLYLGDSPTVSSSAFPGTPNGAFVQGAKHVELSGTIEYRTDNTALAGWRLAHVEDCIRPILSVRCPILATGGGFELVRCTRAVVSGEVVAGTSANAPLVRLTSSTVEILANLFATPSGHHVVSVAAGSGTTVTARGGTWTHAAGSTAGAGVGWTAAADLSALTLDGVDVSGAFLALQADFASLPSLRTLGTVGTRTRQGSMTVTGDDEPPLRVLAGGVEVLRVGSTPPALTYSRAVENAADTQLRTALVSLKLVTDSTTA